MENELNENVELKTDEFKKAEKKRLSPGSTVFLTIGALALFTVVGRILYFCITGK